MKKVIKKILLSLVTFMLALVLLATCLIWLGHVTRKAYFESLERQRLIDEQGDINEMSHAPTVSAHKTASAEKSHFS